MAKKESGPDDIMAAPDMKPILARAKRGDPASAAFCITKAKEGVLLLDKKKKPKSLVAMMKKQAIELGLELDMPSMRFGKASVDTDVDAAMVTFTINKDVSGAMRPKMIERLKRAGYSKVEFVVDEGLENEPAEDPAADAPAEAAPAAGPAAPAEQEAPAPAAAAPAEAPEAPTGPAANEAADPADQAAQQPADDGGMQKLTKQLADLIKQIPGVLSNAPDQKDALVKLATAAGAAVKGSDVGAAQKAVDALGSAIKAAPSAASPSAGALPAASLATLAKTSIAWKGTCGALEKQCDTLLSKMVDAYKDHGFAADLEKFFKSKVEPVLENFDESLNELLDDVAKSKDAAEQRKLMAEAQKVIAKYESYLASEPLIKQLDDNPFMPLQLEATLTKTLVTLNSTITSLAGSMRA